MTRTSLINQFIARQGYRSYLEIGLGDGAHFRAVHCAEKESVDPEPSRSPTHPLTSDEFFARNRRRYDLIFIDGLHHCDTVARDLRHALAALTPGGMVVCHDLNPTTEVMQAVPRQTRDWTGDCWKAWVRLRQEHPGLPALVADTDYGVGIIFPEGKYRSPPAAAAGADLSWEDFARNRRQWLNLVPCTEVLPLLFAESPPPHSTFLHLTPYAQDGNLAAAYNQAIASLPGDWFLFTDADIMFLSPRYGHLIESVIAANPRAGLITCVTNRIGAASQLTEHGLMKTDSLLELRRLALERWKTYGSTVTPIKAPASGFLMLFPRSTWERVGGFKGQGLLEVDWRFSREVEAAGLPLLRMEGLLVAHFYRLDGHTSSHPG